MATSDLALVRSLITEPRLRPYLEEAAGDESTALELYAWNVRLSAACMEVLALLEVMLRNAVDRELAAYAREESSRLPWFMCSWVAGESAENVAREIDIVRSRLRKISPYHDSRDQIIAGVGFGFWTDLFKGQHDELWRSALHRAVPGTPGSRRKHVISKLERLRVFRNRIAHHDSLLAQDVLFLLREMLTLAEWIDPSARSWLESHERVNDVYQQRPIMPIDTLIVPADRAWPLYESVFAYVCPPGRRFRPVRYIAFYADKQIKREVPAILHRRDDVVWTDAEASRLAALTGDEHRNDRKIAEVIRASRMSTWREGRYQVFLLSRPGDVRHITLSDEIPHLATGRGSAFVQRHRYASKHSLQSAVDTSQVH
ncbi:hypothetical protein J2W56_000635 [Nocardia kruczakiae]|uniref:Abi-like protein n=1 Tax=Nocardia kruczakiae TaxID=261477 RepID=A0ABU1XA68_9NOCA|nr:hypothetical protein [Nocardia kruczakiae]MDR7166917.1 hypothetical protein [Nocardia kruczakiae]